MPDARQPSRRKPHACPNRFRGEGSRGACLFEIEPGTKDETAMLVVGHSCVYVHQKEIPISWLAEVMAIATAHREGVAGFLRDNAIDGRSYALECDPEQEERPMTTSRKAPTAMPPKTSGRQT